MFRAVLILLAASVAAAQRPGNFQVIGPGGGGAMYHPTVDPHDPQTVLVACDMGGSYITHDSGQSWRMFNLHGAVGGFAFDPQDPNVIYAGGVGLFRSTDKGATWKLLLPRAAKLIGIRDSDLDGDEILLSNEAWATRDGYAPGISAFAVNPVNGRQIYAALKNTLVVTNDGGEHWSEAATLPDKPNQLLIVPTANGKADLWMSSLNGFWNLRRSEHKVPSNEFTVPMRNASMQLVQGRVVLYASSETHFFRAAMNAGDDGSTPGWKALTLPGTGSTVTTFAGSSDGHTLYVSYADLQLDGKVWGGVARSTDDGAHWGLMSKIANTGETNSLRDGWLSGAFDAWWGEEPLGLAVAPNDAQTLYATDLGRAMKSVDGGAHWTALYTRQGGHGWISTGLDVTTSYGVHIDPFDTQRIFVGYTDIGLFRSEDGGASWMPSHDGVPPKWRANAYWVAFDPNVKGRMWAAMARTHDLPRSRMWRNKWVTTFSGGVCVSTDGGKTWQVSGQGLPDSAVTHLLVDPNSTAQYTTLYAVTFGHGVYKSTDGGQSWQEKNTGLTRGGAFAWRMTRAKDGTLYLLIVRESSAATIQKSDRDGALFRSRDGAEHWEQVALPGGVNGPTGLAADPRNPSRLYLAAWGRPSGGNHAEGGGVFATQDGGQHWQPLFTGEQHAYDVTLNPANPAELFVTGFSGSAWRSPDEGAHWKRIAGYNFKNGHRVIADPQHPGQVFITTFGGGVWHGASDAAPGTEDITSKELLPR